ncbi:MAG TPA: hypothetical protein VJQ55_07940 [Candidatus Binatia bacterium]|nr:hypothetical protein [Candidatus Binatia bacterium]
MALTIFWRLILSHVGILLLAGAACLYSIVQLGSLSSNARGALDGNHRMIDYQEAMTDAFLSQVRYGGKYLITHVEARHDQLQQFKKEFVDYLERFKAFRHSAEIVESIARVERLYGLYHQLYDREVGYIRNRQNYAQSRFEQERDKIVESTLDELDGLKVILRTKLQEGLEGIESGARSSRRIAIATTLVVLILGVLLALKVSRDLAGAAREGGEGDLPRNFTSLKTLGSLRLPQALQSWLSAQTKRLPLSAPTLVTAWKRCSTIWNYSSTRKGG